jgi:hypothetical protein
VSDHRSQLDALVDAAVPAGAGQRQLQGADEHFRDIELTPLASVIEGGEDLVAEAALRRVHGGPDHSTSPFEKKARTPKKDLAINHLLINSALF